MKPPVVGTCRYCGTAVIHVVTSKKGTFWRHRRNGPAGQWAYVECRRLRGAEYGRRGVPIEPEPRWRPRMWLRRLFGWGTP